MKTNTLLILLTAGIGVYLIARKTSNKEEEELYFILDVSKGRTNSNAYSIGYNKTEADARIREIRKTANTAFVVVTKQEKFNYLNN